MSNIEYLYRYTSLESLALILKSRQIRLNPLDKMDDLQEQKTADVLGQKNLMRAFPCGECTPIQERESESK